VTCLLGRHRPGRSSSTQKKGIGKRYDLKLWIGSGDVSAAYLPG
jgi:hypothetical protein